MKKTILLSCILCITLLAQAQVTKTVATTAGGLSTALTSTELSTVTNLTITGTLDTRDFVTLRDQMPELTVLDISNIRIDAYAGSGGTTTSISYPANEIPDSSFYFVSANNGKMSLQKITLPTTITSIGDGAFLRCAGLSSITIPNSVLIIGNFAFAYCYNMYTLIIGNSVTNIGNGAFYNSGISNNVIIPNNVTTIGHFAFRFCYYLVNITIGNSVTFIGDWAFAYCNRLTSIFIPKLVTYIGDGAFYGCSVLATVSSGRTTPISVFSNTFTNIKADCTLQVPIGTKAGYQILDYWKNFKTITENEFEILTKYVYPSGSLNSLLTAVEKNITTNLTLTNGIDARDFVTMRDQMPALTVMNLSNAVITSYTGTAGTAGTSSTVYPANTIPYGAFYGCNGITSISLPISITSIGDYAFGGCIGITEGLAIPNLVNVIGYGAFYNCSGITNVIIGGSVTSIGEFAFGNCNALQKISVLTATPPITNSSTFSNVNKTTCALEVPTGSKSSYQASNNWKDFSSITEKTFNIKTINVITAGTLSSLLSASDKITITDLTVTGNIDARDIKCMRDEITYLAVLDLSIANIQAYTGTEGVTSSANTVYNANMMPDWSFISHTTYKSKTSLKKIILPNSLLQIGNYSFYSCENLASVNISNTVTSIGDAAFASCTKLENIAIPNCVILIGQSAFSSCGLKNITIPSTVNSIGNQAFTNCRYLTSIIVEQGNVFYSSLDSVLFNYDKSVLILHPISKLGDYIIPNTVNSISNNAFDNNTGLSNLLIPNSVTSIGNYAFNYCSGLKNITIPSSVNSIGQGSFSNCTGLTSAFIGNYVTSIGSMAFMNCYTLNSIYVNSVTPCNLSSSNYIFNGVPTTSILYVPVGSVAAYQAANQWKDFTNIVEMNTTELPIQAKETVNLYPNPVTESFQIDGLEGVALLTFTDIGGKVMFAKQVTSKDYISVGTLPKGIYIAKLTTKEGTVERKIVKN